MKVSVVAAALFALSLFGHGANAAERQRGPGLSARVYGNSERGGQVIEMWCASCHRMGAVIDDRVPSLASVAASPTWTDGAIRAFLMKPHKPMPPLELSTQQIEDIVAYIGALRRDVGKTP